MLRGDGLACRVASYARDFGDVFEGSGVGWFDGELLAQLLETFLGGRCHAQSSIRFDTKLEGVDLQSWLPATYIYHDGESRVWTCLPDSPMGWGMRMLRVSAPLFPACPIQ